MASRNMNKLSNVKQEIINSWNKSFKVNQAELSANLILKVLDLSSFQSIFDFCKEINANYKFINYLFNNAAVMAIPHYTETFDGYEQQIGVNHLGHYYLTRLLMPTLQNAHARIITVSSRSHYKAPNPINLAIEQMEKALDDSDAMKVDYSDWRNYGISKAFNILFARELQRRYDVISVSLHPGVIKSGLQRFMTEDAVKNKQFDKNIQQGTATQLWMALMLVEDIVNGGYYVDCNFHNDQLREDMKPQNDGSDTLKARLWKVSESLIKNKGFGFEMKSLNDDAQTRAVDEL